MTLGIENLRLHLYCLNHIHPNIYIGRALNCISSPEEDRWLFELQRQYPSFHNGFANHVTEITTQKLRRKVFELLTIYRN